MNCDQQQIIYKKKSNSHHKLQKLSTEKETTQILPWNYGMLCSLWNLSIPSICIWYQEFDKNFAHAHIDKLDFERSPNNGEAGTAKERQSEGDGEIKGKYNNQYKSSSQPSQAKPSQVKSH